MATNPLNSSAPLKNDMQTDVCIIGSGIAGLSTAYHLMRRGRNVVVIDDGPLISGETSRTTAHLASGIDDGFVEIERIHGLYGAQLAMQSHYSAINRIEEIVRLERIDCDFKRLDGYLFSASGDTEELEKEFQAASRAGFADIEFLKRSPQSALEAGPCIRYPAQGKFHPLKYLAGLINCIQNRGGSVFGNTHAQEISGGHKAMVRTTGGYTIRCEYIVVATNTPVNDRVAIHTKQAPYRTYVIAGCVPSGEIPDALYWDTADPYHYVRLQHIKAGESLAKGEYDLLIIGGEDHKTGQADDAGERFYRLETWARPRFPQMDTIEFKWSGQVMETIDGLGFIGENPGDAKNVLIATGDSGQGMTHGTIAGMLLTDIIMGVPNAWSEIYNPSRVRLHSLGDFATEQANVLRQYGDYMISSEIKNREDILPGCGAVISSGMSKHAVYRDTQGEFHEFSAVCPHMKCVLRWNSLENSWDCPCHGSRFDPYGQVLNGPSNENLSRVTHHAHA